MNQWSRTRKRIIFLILFLSVVVLVGVPIFFLFYRAPTCFDGKLNGDESGVDCGGSCQLLCSPEALPLIVRGDPRVLTIATSTYEVVALVENPNSQAEVYRAGYTLKLYGSDNALAIKTIEGETYVPKGATFALFEGPFILDAAEVPTRATFEWKKGSLIWQKNVSLAPELNAKDQLVSKTESTPRLEATVENLSLESVSNIDLVAVISDKDGNIFASSKTFIDALPAGGEAPIIFTWPRPFTGQVADIDIYIRVFPDRSFLR